MGYIDDNGNSHSLFGDKLNRDMDFDSIYKNAPVIDLRKASLTEASIEKAALAIVEQYGMPRDKMVNSKGECIHCGVVVDKATMGCGCADLIIKYIEQNDLL